MDSIGITIKRNVLANGNGGTVVDNATVVLPDFVLDQLCGAFAAAYGVHSVDGVPVSLERNVAYRLRTYATEVLSAAAIKNAAVQATSTKAVELASMMANVAVVG